MFQKLSLPYFLETSVTNRWRTCIFFSAFVFLFLLVFQPFGLNNSEQSIVTVCLGYGLTTFTIMSVLNIVVPPLFGKYFSEEKWTVGREFAWTLLNLAAIGFGNALFNSFIQAYSFFFGSVFLIEAYTLAVGIFPIAISILIKEARLKKKYEKKSEEINVSLKQSASHTTNEIISVPTTVAIPSENNENFILLLNDLLYIQSSDNYVEVFYLKKQDLSKKLLRSSLKAVTESLGIYPGLFRCHKSYLVNLQKVTHVSGNAQGYKLHLAGCEMLIPVSRQLNSEIKTRLAAAP